MTSTVPILFKKYGVDRIRPHLYIRAPLPLCGLGQNNATARLQRQAKCEKSWVATNEIFAVATNTAWTGNTPSSGAACRLRTVHPRVGGEHGEAVPPAYAALGSSPRGRGTRFARELLARLRRFIPAWAGNTSNVTTRARSTDGSSPRGRGTRAGNRESWREVRFIPAWAGNTSRRTTALPNPPVHPRVGGEHVSESAKQLPYTGSSPRGRGTR